MSEIDYKDGIDAAAFLALVARVWPRELDEPQAATALDGTVNLGAWDGDRLVGTVRLLTDGNFFGTIPEILVDPEYQSRGIGRELMQRIVERSPRG